MARIRVRRNFRFSDIDLRPSAPDMKAAGEQLAADIKARAERGDGEQGGFARKADGSRSTLTASGQMLDDLDVIEATPNRLRVGFRTRRSQEIARYHQQGTRHMPARPFLGLDTKMIDGVMRRFKAAIRRGR